MTEMPITNDQLPANHQDVDDIVEVEDPKPFKWIPVPHLGVKIRVIKKLKI